MTCVASLLCLKVLAETETFPPYCPALNRALTWDANGAYALSVERPLTNESDAIVRSVMSGELGGAESIAREQMKWNETDLVPAWVLAQIVRVRKSALNEYRRNVAKFVGQPGTTPVLLYRLHVCRLAENELLRKQRGTGEPEYDRMEADLKTLHVRLQPASREYLGVAISLTQVSPSWALFNRDTLEAYRSAHPRGVDVRPLLCQAYISGLETIKILPPPPFPLHFPEEPQPEKTLEIAQSILKDRPKDPFGHFYTGTSQFRLKHRSLAEKEIGIALNTGELPPLYEQVCRAFLANPTAASLRRPPVPY